MLHISDWWNELLMLQVFCIWQVNMNIISSEKEHTKLAEKVPSVMVYLIHFSYSCLWLDEICYKGVFGCVKYCVRTGNLMDIDLKLLNELGISITKPIKMFYDNQAAISIAKYPVHHDRMKHWARSTFPFKENREIDCISDLSYRLQDPRYLIYWLKLFHELTLKNWITSCACTISTPSLRASVELIIA